LLGAQFGGGEDAVGAGWLPLDGGEFGERGFFDGLICGKSGEALRGGGGVADECETDWHVRGFSERGGVYLRRLSPIILVVRLGEKLDGAAEYGPFGMLWDEEVALFEKERIADMPTVMERQFGFG